MRKFCYKALIQRELNGINMQEKHYYLARNMIKDTSIGFKLLIGNIRRSSEIKASFSESVRSETLDQRKSAAV